MMICNSSWAAAVVVVVLTAATAAAVVAYPFLCMRACLCISACSFGSPHLSLHISTILDGRFLVCDWGKRAIFCQTVAYLFSATEFRLYVRLQADAHAVFVYMFYDMHVAKMKLFFGGRRNRIRTSARYVLFSCFYCCWCCCYCAVQRFVLLTTHTHIHSLTQTRTSIRTVREIEGACEWERAYDALSLSACETVFASRLSRIVILFVCLDTPMPFLRMY